MRCCHLLALFIITFFLTWALVSLINTVRLHNSEVSLARFSLKTIAFHAHETTTASVRQFIQRPSFPNAIAVRALPRHDRSINVSMIIVVTQGTDSMSKYEKALNSLRCYSLVHGYPLHVIVDDVYEDCQKHRDKFFRRHCTIGRFMAEKMRPNDWLFVMDADVAVINPNILLEQYINSRFDVTMFDRFFNWEVAALSYIVRNTAVGRKFVRTFASWEFNLPSVKGHGTDNGALHPYLMELLAPGPSKIKEVCYEIWNRSETARDLFSMEACARMVFGDRIEYPEKSLRILPKGTAWARDIYLLRSAWADDDFMLHAAKEDNFRQFDPKLDNIAEMSDQSLITWLPQDRTHSYVFPILRSLDFEQCRKGKVFWDLDGRLRISNKRKKAALDMFEFGVLKMRMGFLTMLADIFEKKSGLR